MCQRATELQRTWSPKLGDFFITTSSYCSDSLDCSDSRMCSECIEMSNTYVISGLYDYHEELGGTHWFYGGRGCVRGTGNKINSTSCYVLTRSGETGIFSPHECHPLSEYVWLPRQDQLQKMVWLGLSGRNKMDLFVDYIDKTEYSFHSNTMETLWLSAYMDYRHNKRWSRSNGQWEEIID